MLSAFACYAAAYVKVESKDKHCEVLGEFIRELILRKIKPLKGNVSLVIAGTQIGQVEATENEVWDNTPEDGEVKATDALYPPPHERTFVIPEGSLLDPTPAVAGRPYDKSVGFISPPRPAYRGEQREGEIGGSDFP